jgi:diphthamide synthase (EF-2-diphthine--ammonia ligase)
MKGLFNKVRNRPTRRRYVVSTILKETGEFETAVFETNFFYIPRSFSRPALCIQNDSKDDAWALHHQLAARLAQEYPVKLFEELRRA